MIVGFAICGMIAVILSTWFMWSFMEYHQKEMEKRRADILRRLDKLRNKED